MSEAKNGLAPTSHLCSNQMEKEKSMANPGELTKGMARLLGVSEVSVRAHDRVLSEAGLRKTGGRGRSAPTMASEDAARLLVAVMSGGQAKDAAASVEAYSNLNIMMQRNAMLMNGKMLLMFDYRDPPNSVGLHLALVDNLPVNHTLFEMLDALVFAAKSGMLEAAAGDRTPVKETSGLRSIGTWEIEIRISGPNPSAEVSIGCDELAFTAIYGTRRQESERGELRREFSVTHQTILGLGQILRSEAK